MLAEKDQWLWASLAMLLCGLPASSATMSELQSANTGTILQTAGVQGGLVVHLGCGQGRGTAALCPNERYIVQGLERDVAAVQAARKHIRSLGLYGRVSVRHWSQQRLPYGTNTVNLVVIGSDPRIPVAEIERVLAPRGVVMARGGLEVSPDTARRRRGVR